MKFDISCLVSRDLDSQELIVPPRSWIFLSMTLWTWPTFFSIISDFLMKKKSSLFFLKTNGWKHFIYIFLMKQQQNSNNGNFQTIFAQKSWKIKLKIKNCLIYQKKGGIMIHYNYHKNTFFYKKKGNELKLEIKVRIFFFTLCLAWRGMENMKWINCNFQNMGQY